jgi:adenosine deaminase
MSTAFDIYTKLKQTSSDDERAEVIAQAFDALEARFPQITDLATQSNVRETELHLQKEIKEIEARLQKEIKDVELQIREVDARLQERISQLEVSLHQALAAQTRWLIGGLAILGVVLKLADLLIG